MNSAFIARLLVIAAELAQLIQEIQTNQPHAWQDVSANYAEALKLWQTVTGHENQVKS